MSTAVSYYKKSAGQGYPPAMYHLAKVYLFNEKYENIEEGLFLLCKGALWGKGYGPDEVKAYIELEHLYYTSGVQSYLDIFLSTIHEGIKKGSKERELYNNEYYFLGWCSYTGIILPKDEKQAKLYWDKSLPIDDNWGMAAMFFYFDLKKRKIIPEWEERSRKKEERQRRKNKKISFGAIICILFTCPMFILGEILFPVSLLVMAFNMWISFRLRKANKKNILANAALVVNIINLIWVLLH